MPAEIVVVAQLWVPEENLDEVVGLLTRVAEYTHANEPGALAFALHRNAEDPRHLTVIEAFSNEDALAVHRASEVYEDLMTRLGEPGVLERRERLILEPLGVGDPVKGYVA